MTSAFISLFFAAGVGAWVYAKFGRRIGYGNSQNVWTIVGVTFVLVFLVAYTTLHLVLGFS